MSKSITIIGAGLVGSLLSVLLSKRGYSVQLIERRPDPTLSHAERGRSINLALSVRGLKALELVGLKEKVLESAIRMPGRMIHLKDSSTHFYPYGIYEHEAIYSISRSGLNELLLEEAKKSGNVQIQFNTRVQEYHAESSTLTLKSTTNDKVEKKIISPIIATDGSASAIRSGLAKANDAEISETMLNYGYKELTIPPAKGGSSIFKIESQALHIWPRATHMLIALPNLDGSFTVTLFLPFTGEKSFESLTTPESVANFFNEEFPNIPSLMPQLTEDFFNNPTGHMVTVKSSNWHLDGKCLLLGDAAHAIVPFFGQGMNAGFEDVSILNDIFNQGLSDWESIFIKVFEQRKINTDAIADMAQENFIEMRDKVADERFQCERQIEKKLEKEFPDSYISRYRMVSFSNIPYSIASEVGKIENEILSVLYDKYKSPENLNLEDAKTLIDQHITQILSPHISHSVY